MRALLEEAGGGGRGCIHGRHMKALLGGGGGGQAGEKRAGVEAGKKGEMAGGKGGQVEQGGGWGRRGG